MFAIKAYEREKRRFLSEMSILPINMTLKADSMDEPN